MSSPGLPTITGATNGDGSKMNEAQVAAVMVFLQNRNDVMYATTNFWGEYTLVR